MYVHGASQGRRHRLDRQQAGQGPGRVQSRVGRGKTAPPAIRGRGTAAASPETLARWQQVWGRPQGAAAATIDSTALQPTSSSTALKHSIDALGALALVSVALSAGCASGRPEYHGGGAANTWETMSHLSYFVQQGDWRNAAASAVIWVCSGALLAAAAGAVYVAGRYVVEEFQCGSLRPVKDATIALWGRTVGMRRGNPTEVIDRLIAATRADRVRKTAVSREIQAFARAAVRTGDIDSLGRLLNHAVEPEILNFVGSNVWHGVCHALMEFKGSKRREAPKWLDVHQLLDKLRPCMGDQAVGTLQLDNMLYTNLWSKAEILDLAARLSAGPSDGCSIRIFKAFELQRMIEQAPSHDQAAEVRLVQAFLTAIAQGVCRAYRDGQMYWQSLDFSSASSAWWERVVRCVEGLQRAGRWVEAEAMLGRLQQIRQRADRELSRLAPLQSRQDDHLLAHLSTELDVGVREFASAEDSEAALGVIVEGMWSQVASARAARQRYRGGDDGAFGRGAVARFVQAVLPQAELYAALLPRAVHTALVNRQEWATALLDGRLAQRNESRDAAHGKLVEALRLAGDAAQRRLAIEELERFFERLRDMTDSTIAPEWHARYAAFQRQQLAAAVEGLGDPPTTEQVERLAALVEQLKASRS